MKNELAALEELQSLDLEILKQRKEAGAIPENLEAMRKDVAHVGEILELEKKRLADAEEWRVEREKDITLQNELLGRSKAKLQAVRNEKESKAAQREIEVIRKTIQEREEEAIKVLEAIEQYRIAISKHSAEFGELEKHLAESEEVGKMRMGEIEMNIGKTAERREELASRVSQKTYRLYQRIHNRLGQAVVEALEGHCTGCNIDILPQMYNELQRCDKMYQCPNCFRILIYKKDPDNNESSEE